ncbi:jg13733 [Pararge aegeria aegeria]|uniref:Jg13733 protein n=2 Tax=Pararge aegeria TaxID=116150 RepID=A0A8S4RQ87_9NEOP|nr:jg13733 [Pararge aegeria aegeria]
MPAVKAFSIFGGQKPTEKQPATPPAQGAMQKFYRTFSVGPDTSTEIKGGKVTAIAACLEKRISEPPKLNSDCVQKLLNKVSDSVNEQPDIIKGSNPAYENIIIVPSDTLKVKKNLSEETKGYSSVYENITIFGADSKTNKINKLNKALESFDKILYEFSSNLSLSPTINTNKSNFIVPKLQKSKTCSIIESRCILKKSISDPETERRTRNQVTRNNSIDKTTSLWNLDDMKEKELNGPLKPLTCLPNEKMNPDKYATYKISSKTSPRVNSIKTEDLKKLDVKTRILKKTFSNPPSTPVPVVSKTKLSLKKVERKVSDPKKSKSNVSREYAPKSQMQKAKSVWELGNEAMISPNLERTKSSTSIAGSHSKIPVIRSQMSQNKFSSTRALFSPTPVDLNNVDQTRECAQKKKLTASRKTTEKFEQMKQIRQKSQLNLKSDTKRQFDKTKKDVVDKKASLSPKTSLRDYSDEINAVRAKLQQRKINIKRDVGAEIPEPKQMEPQGINSTLSPVKYIVKKLEFQTAMESKSDLANFINCKVIPPVHKELCVANTTFHNHLSTLVGRQIKCIEPRDDIKTCSQIEKHKLSEEKISDTHSDCSDDSGHVSNDASNDNDVAFDSVHEGSPGRSSVDEIDCKIFSGPKQFRMNVPENVKNVCPVRPARRGERANEVDSGTLAIGTGTPKVEEQVSYILNILIATNYKPRLLAVL